MKSVNLAKFLSPHPSVANRGGCFEVHPIVPTRPASSHSALAIVPQPRKKPSFNRSMGQGVSKPRGGGSSKNQLRPSVVSYQESKSRMGDASSPSSSVKVHPKLPQAQAKTTIKENDKPTSAIIIFLSARMSQKSKKIYNITNFNTTRLIFKYLASFSLLSSLPSPMPRCCESQWSDQMVTLDWP